jgi:flagellar hook-associated protein 3 FlgL
MDTMRVANMVPDMEYNLQQSQQSLAQALQQVTTGLRVNQPSDDPAAAATMTISLAASANVDQYTQNISSVTSQMQTADSSFSSIVTSRNSALTLGTSGAGSTVSTANKQAIATEVQGVLSSVVAQANASYQGVYLFAGSASSTLPLVPASTTYTSEAGTVAAPLTAAYPLTAGSVTSISDASTGKTFVFTASAGATIAQLSAAVANAAAAGTLSAGTTATINATGQLAIGSNSSADGIAVSTNDPALGAMNAVPGTEVTNAYAYVGNATINNVPVGDSLSVATNVPGSQLFTSGANIIGSLNSLITALQNGTSAQIQTATAAVSTSLNSVSQQRVPLDNSISQLSSQESFLNQETLTLTTQQTALVGVNLATSATNLAQAETANSAVLAAAAKVLPQTLLSYLSQG